MGRQAEGRQFAEGLACSKLPSSWEREMDGKKLNSQEIDSITILPVERRQEGRREGKMDRGLWERLEEEEI